MLGTDRPAEAVVLEGRKPGSILGDAGERTRQAAGCCAGASSTIIDVGRLVVVIETQRAIWISDRREVAEGVVGILKDRPRRIGHRGHARRSVVGETQL